MNTKAFITSDNFCWSFVASISKIKNSKIPMCSKTYLKYAKISILNWQRLIKLEWTLLLKINNSSMEDTLTKSEQKIRGPRSIRFRRQENNSISWSQRNFLGWDWISKNKQLFLMTSLVGFMPSLKNKKILPKISWCESKEQFELSKVTLFNSH